MNKDRTAKWLSYIYTFSFIAVVAAQFYFAWHNKEINDGLQRMLDISLGVLFALVLASKDYNLGSSAGSDKKTDLLMATKKDARTDADDQA